MLFIYSYLDFIRLILNCLFHFFDIFEIIYFFVHAVGIF